MPRARGGTNICAHRSISLPSSHRRRHERAAENPSASNVLLADALQRMARDKISSLLVVPLGFQLEAACDNTAIITERDVLRAIGENGDTGADATGSPVRQQAPGVGAGRCVCVFALGRMSRLKVRHLGVENEHGEICGIITSRDLLRLRAQEAAILGDEIDQADDMPALGAAWARLPQAAEGLLAEGVSARDIAAVISRELGALTGRAGVLAERRMKADGQGDPPCAYALCILGSAGRGESLLAMDQDNAIIFRRGRAGVRRRSMVCPAGRHCRRHFARDWRALLHGRRHGP